MDEDPARPRESGDPAFLTWIPAFAGMSGDEARFFNPDGSQPGRTNYFVK